MPHSIQKKILIVVESIDVEDSSGSKANVALIRNLNELGYELQVIHYTRKEVILDGILCVAIKEQRLSFLFYLSRLERYIRYFLKIELNKFLENLFGFSFTLLNDRNSIVRAIKSSIEWNPDLILTLSKGGSFRPHHALLKVPSMHNKWMAYIHDPYPMHWYPNPYPWFEPGFKQKERFIKNVANKAKLLAFPSKILLEWMGAHFSPFKTKGIVIPHQIVRKEKIIESLPLYFNEKNFNLVHAGNLINGRNPKGLVLGFKKFLEDNVEARLESRLIFLGGENFYSKMLAQYANNNPQLLLSPKKLSFDLVQNLQQKSSVNIILEARSEISPFLPGKFPHCVQANKLILHIGPLNSEVKRLLGKEYPYHSEIDNVEEISSLIEKLYFRWKEDVLNMELNRPDIVKYLSKDHLIDQMKLSFNRLEGYHLS